MSDKRALITVGATTTHGGKITEGLNQVKIHGEYVHLEGMGHYCPQCKIKSYSIGSDHSKKFFGKSVILDGDLTTCGARLIAKQHNVCASPITKLKNNFIFGSELSDSNKNYQKQFQLVNEHNGMPLANTVYQFLSGGQIIGQGISDGNGFTKIIESDEQLHIEVQILEVQQHNDFL